MLSQHPSDRPKEMESQREKVVSQLADRRLPIGRPSSLNWQTTSVVVKRPTTTLFTKVEAPLYPFPPKGEAYTWAQMATVALDYYEL